MRLKSYLPRSLKVARGGMNLATRKLFSRQFIGSTAYTDYPFWLRTYHRQYVREVLDYERMMLKHLFHRQRLEGIVNSFLAGRNDLVYFFTSLMSLELWLRTVMPH